MKLSAGQHLWFVPGSRRGAPHWIKVDKVGRKWAHAGDMRLDLETLTADGGQYISPGRCYLTKEEHDAELLLVETWGRFRKLMDGQHRVPNGIRPSQIENAARALFGESVLPKQPQPVAATQGEK